MDTERGRAGEGSTQNYLRKCVDVIITDLQETRGLHSRAAESSMLGHPFYF